MNQWTHLAHNDANRLVASAGARGAGLVDMDVKALIGDYEFKASYIEWDSGSAAVTPSNIVTKYLESGETDVVTFETAVRELRIALGLTLYGVLDLIDTELVRAALDEDDARREDALLQRYEMRSEDE